MGDVLRVVAFVILFLALLAVGPLLFDYSFNFWVPKIVNHPVHLPLWGAILGGIVLNGINIPIAIVTLIASCAM